MARPITAAPPSRRAACRDRAAGKRAQDAPLVTRRAEAQRLADAWLQDLWAAREGAEFELSPRRIDLEPGDVVSLPTDAGQKLHRIVRIADGPTRKITSRAIEPAVFETPGLSVERPLETPAADAGKPLVVVLDLPASVRRSGASAICRGGGRSVAGRRHHLAFGERRELLRASHPRPAGYYRHDHERARAGPALALGSESGPRCGDFIGRYQRHRRRGGARRRQPLCVARPSTVGGKSLSAARAELDRRASATACRASCGDLRAASRRPARTVPAGAPVVRLDEAVVPLTSDLRDLGQTWRYRIGPAGLDHARSGLGRICRHRRPRMRFSPFSPVHVIRVRLPGGVSISWLRRLAP